MARALVCALEVNALLHFAPSTREAMFHRLFLPYAVLRDTGRRYATLLRPQRTKYRKMHKNIRAVLPIKPDYVPTPPLNFGTYGIYAMESICLNAEQIEAARMAILKTVGRKQLKIWVRVFPHIPVTKKPLEVRMGKGKGSVDRFVAYVKAGRLLYEFNCPSASLAKAAYKQAAYKLPIKVRFTEKSNT